MWSSAGYWGQAKPLKLPQGSEHFKLLRRRAGKHLSQSDDSDDSSIPNIAKSNEGSTTFLTQKRFIFIHEVAYALNLLRYKEENHPEAFRCRIYQHYSERDVGGILHLPEWSTSSQIDTLV